MSKPIQVGLFVSLVLLSTFPAGAQRDAGLIFGYSDYPELGYVLSTLSFQRGQARFSFFGENPHPEDLYTMGAGSALYSETGNLLLYTGGCDVRRPGGTMVPGTQPLVADDTAPWCEEGGTYDGDIKNELFLPAPDHWADSVAYLLIGTNKFSGPNISNSGLALLRFARRRGNYTLTARETLVENESFIAHALAAHPAPEALGGGWWVPRIEAGSNRWRLYRMLGDRPVKVSYVRSATGPVWDYKHFLHNQLVFSPNGRYLAVNGGGPGTTLYRFDAATGTLRFLFSLPHGRSESPNYLGAAWSPDSRHLYYGCPDAQDAHLCTIDMDAAVQSIPPANAVVRLGTIPQPSYYNNWPYSFGDFWLAPDCRIYVDPRASNLNMHIIDHPNRGGAQAGLVINAVESPTRFYTKGFISFPNYRAVSGCDSTISPLANATSSETQPTAPATALTVFPNPAIGTTVLSGLQPGSEVRLIGRSGEVMRVYGAREDSTRQLDLRNLPQGLFYLEATSPNGQVAVAELVLGTGR